VTYKEATLCRRAKSLRAWYSQHSHLWLWKASIYTTKKSTNLSLIKVNTANTLVPLNVVDRVRRRQLPLYLLYRNCIKPTTRTTQCIHLYNASQPLSQQVTSAAQSHGNNLKNWQLKLHCHLKRPVLPIIFGFNRRTHRAPVCQVSTQSGLCGRVIDDYWWLSRIFQSVFRDPLPADKSRTCMGQICEIFRESLVRNTLILGRRHVAPFRNYGDSDVRWKIDAWPV